MPVYGISSLFFSSLGWQIWILCEARCFMVTVNGHHQFAYNHRVPNLQQIDKLEVEGDVMLTYVQV